MLLWLNQLWILGRKSERFYLRFYPNPGFMLTLPGLRLKWSWHWGLKVERLPFPWRIERVR